MKQQYAGADWLKRQNVEVSEFGCDVANLLGNVFEGLYHLDGIHHKRTEWDHPFRIEVVVYGELSTFDNSTLTKLVLEAHERAIRVGIKGAANGYLRLKFSKREAGRSDDWFVWHPTIDEARERLGYIQSETETPEDARKALGAEGQAYRDAEDDLISRGFVV